MRKVCAFILVSGILVSGILASCVLASGCRAPHSGATRYETFSQRHTRDSAAAQQRNDAGLAHLEAGDTEKAEEAFRSALEADLFYPAAHNNLGLVLAGQGKAYEAAWEYAFAAKLAPRSAEPRHNLGTLLEHVGRLGEAQAEYEEALVLDPGNLDTMCHLARVYVKTDHPVDELRPLLEKLVYAADQGEWDQWARMWLIRLGDE